MEFLVPPVSCKTSKNPPTMKNKSPPSLTKEQQLSQKIISQTCWKTTSHQTNSFFFRSWKCRSAASEALASQLAWTKAMKAMAWASGSFRFRKKKSFILLRSFLVGGEVFLFSMVCWCRSLCWTSHLVTVLVALAFVVDGSPVVTSSWPHGALRNLYEKPFLFSG